MNSTKCSNLVKDVIFHIMTISDDLRYPRERDWTIGSAGNLDEFIEQNTQYVVDKLQDPEYIENFEVLDDEVTDDDFEAESEIFSILRDMFPIINCMHGDSASELQDKFIPVLREIYRAHK